MQGRVDLPDTDIVFLCGKVCLSCLMQLRVMREKDPSAKALVFSQFVSTIEWLKVRLDEQGFGYRTISGSMTLKRRSQVQLLQSCPSILILQFNIFIQI